LIIHKLKFWYNKQAFTLIELVVVLALVSLFLVIAIPRLDISFLSSPERKLSNWVILTVKLLKENAVRSQSKNILFVDCDNNQMWMSTNANLQNESDTDEVLKPDEMPKENEFTLPSGYRIRDVSFMDNEKKYNGIIEINFYKKGYSDKAVIHILDKDSNNISYMIEPFLLHVKIYEEYIEI